VLFTFTGGSVNITLGQVAVTLYKNVSQEVSVVLNLAGIPYGFYNISASINPGHTIFETNYINDVVVLPVTVYPDVNFAIENANVTGNYLFSPVFVNFTTVNMGNNKFFTAQLQVYYFYNSHKYMLYSNTIPSTMENFSFNFVPNASGEYIVYIDIIQPWDYNQTNNIYSKVLSYNINYYVSSTRYEVAETSIPQGVLTVPVDLMVFVNCSVIQPQNIPALSVSYVYNGSQVGISYVHYVPGVGAVASLLFNVRPGTPYVFNITINSNHAYPETNYFDDFSSLFVEIPIISGSVFQPTPTPYNANATFSGVVNITAGSLTNVSMTLFLGNREFIFPFSPMYAFSSMKFELNQSVALFNITQPNASLPYELIITGAQLGGSGVVLGSGFVTVYHPANVTVVSFGAQNVFTFTVGMYVPFAIKLSNMGGINSTPTQAFIHFGNTTVPVPIPSIPAGAVSLVLFNYNLTQVGSFPTSITLANGTFQGPIINVSPAVYSITATVEPSKVLGGKMFNVTVSVINANASAEFGYPIYASGVLVTLHFAGQSYQKMTSPMGTARFEIVGPTNQSGSLPIFASVVSNGMVQQQQVGVISVSQPFPVLEFTVAFIVVVLGAIGYVAYSASKKAKMKKRRTCPVCGSSIYEGATTCPVCNTPLSGEVENCSTCDTIIPKYSKYCPNCGEIFVDDRDRDYEYLYEIKSKYDEAMDKIFEEYKNMGKAEADFYKWWLNNPGYISFRQFLLKAEYDNKKKECPNCGSINDLQAEACVNCGKQLPQGYTMPPVILQKFEAQQSPASPAQPSPGQGPAVPESKPVEKKKRKLFGR
ncbi:MAG: double zinc ribbon domain-containing protein, partial [Thermoplasmata archaeon]